MDEYIGNAALGVMAGIAAVLVANHLLHHKWTRARKITGYERRGNLLVMLERVNG